MVVSGASCIVAVAAKAGANAFTSDEPVIGDASAAAAGATSVAGGGGALELELLD